MSATQTELMCVSITPQSVAT